MTTMIKAFGLCGLNALTTVVIRVRPQWGTGKEVQNYSGTLQLRVHQNSQSISAHAWWGVFLVH